MQLSSIALLLISSVVAAASVVENGEFFTLSYMYTFMKLFELLSFDSVWGDGGLAYYCG
jgi:hypothetical protein